MNVHTPLAERRPTFKAPPKSCDAHCHVFGPADKFPYAPGRKYTPEDAPKEMLRALHDRLGIDRAVFVQASCHATDNRSMLDAIAADPKRHRGIAIVDETFTDKDFRELDEGGVRGVRFNFVRHLGGHPNMDTFRKVVARLPELGWHLVIHMDAQDIEELTPMIRSLPVPFVVDHMGRVQAKDGIDQPAFKALLELMKMENAWVKVCGSERISPPPYSAAAPFARKLIEAAPDRTLWGTDFPHPNLNHTADDAALVDLVPNFAYTAEEQRRLLVENPQRLYGFTN